MKLTTTEKVDSPKPDGCMGMRHLTVGLLFLGTLVAYATRVSMSIAIVAMTSENNYGYSVFDWDRSIQDTVLSSFFWGYIVLQIPAGMLAAKFGGKYLVFFGMALNGIINLVVPIAADYGGWIAVCACRIGMGLGQGLLYPSLHGLLGQWTPISERSRFGTFVYAGAQLGTVIEMMLAGVLSASQWGWPSVYYVAGAMSLLWCFLWLILGSSSPSQNRWISKQEQKYIEMNCGSHEITSRKNQPTPWKKIWTSLPFLSILFAHAGQSLGFWTLLTEMPTFMSRVLGVDIKSSGFLSALPYIAMYILSFLFSWLADFLVNRNITTVTTSRKIFNTISTWGPAAALCALAYLPPGNVTWAVIILTTTVGLNGSHYVGFLISHIDISPNFASTLMGVTNGLGNILSIMAPLSVSLVVKDESSATEWRKVFFISIAVYFLTNLFFILFMSGEVQEWNEPSPKDEIEEVVTEKKVSNSSSRKVSTGEDKF